MREIIVIKLIISFNCLIYIFILIYCCLGDAAVALSAGATFTPHVITVAPGEVCTYTSTLCFLKKI